jgi:hypothetical protein
MATGEERELSPPEGSYERSISPDGRSLTPYQSRWAPDGKSIVYLVQRENFQQERHQVIVADLETGMVRSQAHLPSKNGYLLPTVAPDGRHLYVARGGNMTNASRVVRIDLQTGEEKEICAARPTVWALSPDGSQIACAGLGDAIQILQTRDGQATDLVRGDQFGPMAWTADGNHLIYTTRGTDFGPSGPGAYGMVAAAGGTPRKLEVPLGTIGLLSVHPGNRQIAISSAGTGTELWVLENVISSSK